MRVLVKVGALQETVCCNVSDTLCIYKGLFHSSVKVVIQQHLLLACS